MLRPYAHSREHLRQQTLKQPIDVSTLPMVVSTAPASLKRRTPPREAQTPSSFSADPRPAPPRLQTSLASISL
jgi:hypothetical protein